MTTSGATIPEVDGLRFVAIGSVFLFHVARYAIVKSGRAFPEDAGFLAYGYLGVPLFFAISGFILALRGAPSLKAYYLRRLTRLEPPYILNLLLCAGLMALAGGAPDLLRHLAASLTYTHNAIYGAPSTLNPVAWSLEVEVQFYALAPLLFLLSRVRWRRLGFAALAAAGMATRPDPRFLLLSNLPYFMAGVVLADIYVHEWRSRPERSIRWDIAAAAGWLGMAYCAAHPAARAVLFPFTIVAAYAGVFRGSLSNAIFRNPWIATIGGMCYTIYLYHYLVISAAGRLSMTWIGPSLGAQAVVLGAVTLVVCGALFLAAERPFMRKSGRRRQLVDADLVRPDGRDLRVRPGTGVVFHDAVLDPGAAIDKSEERAALLVHGDARMMGVADHDRRECGVETAGGVEETEHFGTRLGVLDIEPVVIGDAGGPR